MRAHLTKHTQCILCGNRHITKYISLGKMAPANNFVQAKNLAKPEDKYPLGLTYCHLCHNSQLTHTVTPSKLFTHYAYFSSTSPRLVTHFIEYANTLKSRFPDLAKQLVVDIGSNDGILLKPLQKLGATVLGVDPAKECSDTAIAFGIPTIQKYFTPLLSRYIQKHYGKAAIITANNVIAHTPRIHTLLTGVQKLLQPEGVFIFEVKYMGDILQKNEFDVIYHEHVFSYLLHPLHTILRKHHMKIIDVDHVPIHGGSLRIYATHTSSSRKIQPSVNQMLLEEQKKKYTQLSTYYAFAKKPIYIKKKLRTLLYTLIKRGKRIAGYGASAKGTTMLQYCDIGTNTLSYIVDSAPSKIGAFTPVTHIPILDPNTLKTDTPDYILLLAWDHKESIMKKEQWFTRKGGKYICPIPSPTII